MSDPEMTEQRALEIIVDVAMRRVASTMGPTLLRAQKRLIASALDGAIERIAERCAMIVERRYVDYMGAVQQTLKTFHEQLRAEDNDESPSHS